MFAQTGFFKQNIFANFLEYEFLENFHYIKKQNNIFVTLIYFQQQYITKKNSSTNTVT